MLVALAAGGRTDGGTWASLGRLDGLARPNCNMAPAKENRQGGDILPVALFATFASLSRFCARKAERSRKRARERKERLQKRDARRTPTAAVSVVPQKTGLQERLARVFLFCCSCHFCPPLSHGLPVRQRLTSCPFSLWVSAFRPGTYRISVSRGVYTKKKRKKGLVQDWAASSRVLFPLLSSLFSSFLKVHIQRPRARELHNMRPAGSCTLHVLNKLSHGAPRTNLLFWSPRSWLVRCNWLQKPACHLSFCRSVVLSCSVHAFPSPTRTRSRTN